MRQCLTALECGEKGLSLAQSLQKTKSRLHLASLCWVYTQERNEASVLKNVTYYYHAPKLGLHNMN